MTAPTERFSGILTGMPTAVRIAGVPWPMYKLVALAVGVLVLGIVAVATSSIGPAVVAASAATTVVWLGLGLFHHAEG